MDFTTYEFPPTAGMESADRSPKVAGKYEEKCGQSHPNKCTINSTIWAPFLRFVGSTGLQLIAGLNALEGRGAPCPTCPWDPQPSLEMLRWSTANYPGVLAGVELGNEPDDFGLNDTNVPTAVLAKNFGQLRALLDNGTAAMKKLAVWGPDVSYSVPLFEGLLAQIPAGVLATNTYHSYYNQGAASISLSSFTDVSVMDSVVDKMVEFGALSKQHGHGAQLALGETSTFSGGGAGSASDTFYAVFLFLDKLGLAARHGHSYLLYQCILDPVLDAQNDHEVTYEIIKEGVPDLQLGGYKELAGSYTPTPNFFASLLWKALMGPKVLAVHQAEPAIGVGTSRFLRSYAHCTQLKGRTNASTFLRSSYAAGAVTLLLINPGETALEARVPQLCTGHSCLRDEYHLGPGATPPLVSSPSPSPTPSYTTFNHTSNLAPGEKLPPPTVIGGTTGSAAAGYHISFLGNFSTWQGCRDNAAQRYRPLANSWTWFSAAAGARATTCYAHRDGVWHPHAEADAVAGNSTGWEPPPPPPPPQPEPKDPLLSIGVRLNGSPLELSADGHIPPLRAASVKGGNASTLVLPPFSVAFFVFPKAMVGLCF